MIFIFPINIIFIGNINSPLRNNLPLWWKLRFQAAGEKPNTHIKLNKITNN